MESKCLIADKIKAKAQCLGFSACGLAPAESVDQTNSEHFRRWLAENGAVGMEYMHRYEEKRLDPRILVEGAKTVISVALNYSPKETLQAEEYQLAWYAYGKDYHDVMKTKLSALMEYLQEEFASTGRVFCDTAPVLERYWAWRCGLGWIGKHTQLIIPHAGSCFFLGEIIVDTEADTYDTPIRNHCGNCTRCLEACPTQALEAPYWLNSGKCLSYLTIEHRGAFPANMGKRMGLKIYGCDECQKACPWNRFSTPCATPEFHPSPALLSMKKEDWAALTEDKYKTLFKGSAVKRAKYEGLMRNIRAVEKPDSSLL